MIHTWSGDGRWGPRDAALLRAWRPTGILAQGLEPDLVTDVAALGIPLVDMSTSPQFFGSPFVGIDQAAVGRMVAEEFRSQGLRHAAYFGWTDQACEQQFAGLSEICLNGRQHRPSSRRRGDPSRQRGSWPCRRRRISGVAAPSRRWDSCSLTILFNLAHAAMPAGWPARVPEDVAIIGVYDDETSCQFAYPAVSSVEVPGERAGYEAARMLDQMMENPDSRVGNLLLPPVGVVARQSSDLVAVEDAEVASAVRFIRLNAHRPLKVSEVFSAVEISPRRLEQRFKLAWGRPRLEIQQVHLNHFARPAPGADQPAVAGDRQKRRICRCPSPLPRLPPRTQIDAQSISSTIRHGHPAIRRRGIEYWERHCGNERSP